MTGQVCSSLTRIVVTRKRHDEMVDALAASFGQVRRRRPVRREDRDGSARRGAPARPGRGLHRQGRRRGRDARGRRRAPEAPRPRLVRRADRVRQRRQRVDDRPGGDLRSGAERHPRRRRARRGADRERHDLRAQLGGVHPRRRPRLARSPATCAPGPSATTRSAPTSGSPSAASSSPASAARAAREGLVHFLETKTVILDEPPAGYATTTD